jgi:hypothetical protein
MEEDDGREPGPYLQRGGIHPPHCGIVDGTGLIAYLRILIVVLCSICVVFLPKYSLVLF